MSREQDAKTGNAARKLAIADKLFRTAASLFVKIRRSLRQAKAEMNKKELVDLGIRKTDQEF